MSRLARWFARRLWWGMLWLMRTQFMKQAQRRFEQRLPVAWRPRAHESLIRQNRFARRIGLPLVTFMFNLIFASLIISFTFQIVMAMYTEGTLTPPDRILQKAQSSSEP